jgi:quinoprotein dehydrogenase-associated probable ABC transporter substrate-binding protein
MCNERELRRLLITMTWALLGVGLVAFSSAARSAAEPQSPGGQSVLRVCADPDNLPLSNARGEGYENKIAEQLASDLGRRLEYAFFPQRMGFVRNTLRQKDPQTQQFKCDVIIGVPKGYELTATTRPYMRSTYALVFRHRPELENLETADDLLKLSPERLRALRIGVFGRSPGADWLLRNDLLDRAVVYAPQSGDPAENPALTIERDLAAERIDMAILWGPMAGFLVRSHSTFPAWRAVPFAPDREIKFDYEISMGVRFGEKEWKARLDEWIAANRSRVQEILTEYRVPLLDADGKLVADFDKSSSTGADDAGKEIPLRLASRAAAVTERLP